MGENYQINTMSKKNNNIIGKVNCEKCNELCDLKEIKEPTEKQLRGAYYYKEWYHCKCGFWGRDEINKVWNKNLLGNHFKQVEEEIITLNGKRYQLID